MSEDRAALAEIDAAQLFAVNLPPRQTGPIRSEVLVLGVDGHWSCEHGSEGVVPLRPDQPCAPGDRVG